VHADCLPQRRAVVECFRRAPPRGVELQALEDPPALRVGLTGDALAVDAEHVEHHQRQRDRRATLQDTLAEQREIRLAVVTERDKLAVEYGSDGQVLEEKDVRRHVPAAPAPDAQCAFG
jgi:hypothetical protein